MVRLAREGWPLVAATSGPALVALAWGPPWLAAPLILAALFTAWFFRDPERVAPQGPGVVAAPADGRVLRVEDVYEGEHLKGPARKVSIFMSPLDVHVNRMPLSGEVLSVDYRRGRFVNAASERASLMNEHNALLIGSGPHRLLCVQVAGFLARRIVCRVRPGQRLAIGERFGLIRFGSRVDLYLPPEAEVSLRPGQRTRAGETVVGYLHGQEQ
jgi:phosphatidylserine decarboxylase